MGLLGGITMKVEFSTVSMNSYKSVQRSTSPSMKATPRIMGAETTALGNNTFMLVDRYNKLVEPYKRNIWKLAWDLKHMVNRNHFIDLTYKLAPYEDELVEILPINMSSKNPSNNPYDKYFLINPPFISKDKYVKTEMRLLPNTREKESEGHYDCQSEQFIAKFVKFIQMMQRGNTLIYSDFQGDLPKILNLNKYFNPQADKDAINMAAMHLGGYDQVLAYENLYNNLTPENKKDMGWTEKFEKDFVRKLNNEKQYHLRKR